MRGREAAARPVLAALVAWLPARVLADLPVHCLRHQLTGHWTFFVGPRSATPQACGHHTPGEVRDVVLQEGHAEVVGVLDTVRLEVVLESPDLASTNSSSGATEVGWWTPVYDQGFEVRLGGRAYFAFSSVTPSSTTPDFRSHCSRTAVGWYRELDSDRDAWGCYYGVQRTQFRSASSGRGGGREGGGGGSSGGSVGLVRGSSAAGAHVSQQNRSLASRAAGARAELDERPDTLKYAGLPASWDWRDVDGVNYVSPVRAQASCGACYAIAAVTMLESRIAIASGGRERPSLSVQEVLSCSPYSQGCLGGFPYLVGKYLADNGVVSESCFPMQAGEGRPLCGERCDGPTRRWRASDYRYVGGRYGGCSEVAMMREIHRHGPIVAGFEAGAALYTFSGDGVFSSASSAAAPADPAFVVQPASLDAAANAPANLVEVVERSSSLLQLDSAAAEAATADDEFVEDGGTNEPPLQGAAPRATAETPSFFERTNHAVVVVGWGVDAGVKYWWAQNTWGEAWGEGGYFRMARGSDESAFESMAVAVDVDGALPLQKRLGGDEALDLVGEPAMAYAEARRVGALRRRATRAPYVTTLAPGAEPPPSPSPLVAHIDEPREHLGRWAASSDSPQHHSLLDALAHWGYGGG